MKHVKDIWQYWNIKQIPDLLAISFYFYKSWVKIEVPLWYRGSRICIVTAMAWIWSPAQEFLHGGCSQKEEKKKKCRKEGVGGAVHRRGQKAMTSHSFPAELSIGGDLRFPFTFWGLDPHWCRNMAHSSGILIWRLKGCKQPDTLAGGWRLGHQAHPGSLGKHSSPH